MDETLAISLYQEHGDVKALAYILEKHKGLVQKIAWSISKNLAHNSDAMQEGFIGFIEGIKNFNPSLGYKVTTYCRWHIIRSITAYHIKHVHGFNISLSSYYKAKNRLGGGLRRDILEGMGVPMPLGDDETNKHIEKNYDDFVANLIDKDEKEILLSNINELEARERIIVLKSFGIDTEKETLERIGKRFGITKQAISIIRLRALKKLKKKLLDKKYEMI